MSEKNDRQVFEEIVRMQIRATLADPDLTLDDPEKVKSKACFLVGAVGSSRLYDVMIPTELNGTPPWEMIEVAADFFMDEIVRNLYLSRDNKIEHHFIFLIYARIKAASILIIINEYISVNENDDKAKQKREQFITEMVMMDSVINKIKNADADYFEKIIKCRSVAVFLNNIKEENKNLLPESFFLNSGK